MKHQDLINQMTLEEKAGLCSGEDYWHFKSIDRLGIPEIMVTDGPHGLRKQAVDKESAGVSNSYPAVCFPTAATTACSWDPDLLYEMGQALGDECRKEKVSVLLGPGVNIKRSPLCGRNFEYFSEDPYLAGKVGASFVNGVQSKGIGTSLKHFAANNQEKRRMTVSTVADERTLREIYLAPFETTVREAQPWTVMNAYNRLNGVYCAENKWLLTDVLRDEWGFKGIVITDWGAENDRVDGLIAGQEVEMPSSGGLNDKKIVEAVRNGTLDEKVLDERVDKVIDIILRSKETLGDYTYDTAEHHELARKVAGQSMVLLKNDDNILPLKKDITVAVIGEMARSPRYQGAGSSQINPIKIDCAFDSLIEAGVKTIYAAGYDKRTDEVNDGLIKDACRIAEKADVALLFIGLTDSYESEGYDRNHMRLPNSHNALVDAVAKVNPNTVVVLSGGSTVEMPWLSKAKGLLNAFLGGEASGAAIADILTGKVNPSGKLSETYPLALSDNPSYKYFPGTEVTTEYRESIFVGYRYYDKAEKEVLFPFGYGLSYTEFKYSALKLNKKKMNDTDELTVSFKVKNVGKVDGAEVCQVYVSAPDSDIFKAKKELKGFKKVFLKAGEETTVTVTLDKRAFAYYNVNIHDWHVESGKYEILVGSSSRDILLNGAVNITSTVEAEVPNYRETAPCYYTADVTNVPDSQFKEVLGREIPADHYAPGTKLTLTNTLEDARDTKWGGKVYKLFRAVAAKVGDAGTNMMSADMVAAIIVETPIRSFISMSMGVFSEEMAEGLLQILNNEKPAAGLGRIVKGFGNAVKNIKNLLNSI